ncbi:NUDIX domain-containing protein [Spirochaeta cellobiosiphila]|uniref:NUDIX domain-containing protein n=1 Tax=Spirochaeta cellobiosiphila TaxID=504483 RepID=UPI00041FDB97|nr:NUDIX domain-containing protein [Spirochaeta cellobiosiphila]
MKLHPVRTSAKAIILHQNKVLTIKKKHGNDTFYVLPGGGQNLNENLHETLERECLEEVGAEIRIKNLVLVRDYISNNHEFAKEHPNVHQLELMFECEILNLENLHVQTELDEYQIGIEWISVCDLENYKLYPLEIRSKIKEINNDNYSPVYLGDIN